MRHHPLTIFYQVYQLMKNNLILIFLIFIVNGDASSWIAVAIRYAFLVYLGSPIIYYIWSWFHKTYDWDDENFYLQKGIWNKQTRTVPFSKIQNTTRKTTVFHKIFRVTSLTFETAMDGKDDAIAFDVVTDQQADFLKDLATKKQVSEVKLGMAQFPEEKPNEEPSPDEDRVVHFRPIRKDLWKATFTSLSFFAFIPILAGIVDRIAPFLSVEEQAEGVLNQIIQSTWLIAVSVILLLLVAIVIGITITVIRYGKYEIASDNQYIVIRRGVINESEFVIDKEKVQGIEVQQTFLKRLWGLAEVKLISTVSPNAEGSSVNVNSLYPFLPLEQAYGLIEEILPGYQVNEGMKRLPRKSLWIKLVRPSWFWMVATAILAYFKPHFFNIEEAWWIISFTLLVLVCVNRILDYVHTYYDVTADQVQWRHGGLTSSLFITKRKKAIEMAVSQSILQKKWNVTSIKLTNRSNPIRVEEVKDVPESFAEEFTDWYMARRTDIQYEQ